MSNVRSFALKHYRKSKYTPNDYKQDFLTKVYEISRNIRGNPQTISSTALHSYYPDKVSSINVLRYTIATQNKSGTHNAPFLFLPSSENDHSDNLSC